MELDNECEFCRIVAGEAPAHVVCEDERTIAFLDRNPAAEGHTIVAPREHVSDAIADGPETVSNVFGTVHDVTTAIEETLEPDGFSVFHTTGQLVGRVTHAHVHVIPRWADDDVTISLHRRRIDDQAAAELAERLGGDG